jgi:hypothetical protein
MNLSKQSERNVLIRTQNVQLLLNTLQKPFFHLVSCWQRRMRRLLLHYPSTSAEFMSRDRFNFIRTKGETWTDTDTYHNVRSHIGTTLLLLCRHLLLLQAQADFVATVHMQCKLASSVRNVERKRQENRVVYYGVLAERKITRIDDNRSLGSLALM